MIDWSSTSLTEPPPLKHRRDEQIEENIRDAARLEESVQYSCYTQGVERLIRLVSEASGKVCGQEARDVYMLNFNQERTCRDLTRRVSTFLQLRQRRRNHNGFKTNSALLRLINKGAGGQMVSSFAQPARVGGWIPMFSHLLAVGCC